MWQDGLMDSRTHGWKDHLSLFPWQPAWHLPTLKMIPVNEEIQLAMNKRDLAE